MPNHLIKYYNYICYEPLIIDLYFFFKLFNFFLRYFLKTRNARFYNRREGQFSRYASIFHLNILCFMVHTPHKCQVPYNFPISYYHICNNRKIIIMNLQFAISAIYSQKDMQSNFHFFIFSISFLHILLLYLTYLYYFGISTYILHHILINSMFGISII